MVLGWHMPQRARTPDLQSTGLLLTRLSLASPWTGGRPARRVRVELDDGDMVWGGRCSTRARERRVPG
eukprot:scaffold35051_cov65-Phaeocystis_antarctica.AAC.2